MWVPKTPPRYDFCGRPPCPLCYDWVDENGVQHPGYRKFQWDILGPNTTPTVEQQQTLDEAADKVHVANLRLNEQDGVARFHEEDDRQRLQRKLQAKAKDKPIAKKEPRKPTLDEIDVAAIVEKKKAAEYLLQMQRDSYEMWGRLKQEQWKDYGSAAASAWPMTALGKARRYLESAPDTKVGDMIMIPVLGGHQIRFEVVRDLATGQLDVKERELVR